MNVFSKSRSQSDLPIVQFSEDDDYHTSDGLASGWLNKLPIGKSKHKKRGAFKRRFFVLHQTGPSAARLSYFPNMKLAARPTAEWSDKAHVMMITPVTTVVSLDDNCLQLKAGGKVLTMQPVLASLHKTEAKAKQQHSRDLWLTIFKKIIQKIQSYELKSRRIKRSKSTQMRHNLVNAEIPAKPKPFCKGYMYKLPRHKKKGAWKRRYFVLVVDGLHYLTKEPQLGDNLKETFTVNTPEYLDSFAIHPQTQITRLSTPLSGSSQCPRAISIENENNEVMVLHPDASDTGSGRVVLKQWVDALRAAVEYSREIYRRQHLVRNASLRLVNGIRFSLVIGHEQPSRLEITSSRGAKTPVSANMYHEYFCMAPEETIGDLVTKIVDTLNLIWLEGIAILFRGPAIAGKRVRKVGFLGDEGDAALEPSRTMQEFTEWAGKANFYTCFIPPGSLDWSMMMPWEYSAAHNRRLLVRDLPLEFLDSAVVSPSDSGAAKGEGPHTLRRSPSLLHTLRRAIPINKKFSKNKTNRDLSRPRHSAEFGVTKAHLSAVVMLRQKSQYAWHLRLEIIKAVGLNPNRTRSEQCEVECSLHKITSAGNQIRERVYEVHGKKETKVVKDMKVPVFEKASQPERFDFMISSPNITSLTIILKSGGRHLAKVDLEPLDIVCFASSVFYNQVEKHVEAANQSLLYEEPMYEELTRDKLIQYTRKLPDGDSNVANQVSLSEVGRVFYILNTELLRPNKDNPRVFEGWLLGRIDRIDIPITCTLLSGEYEVQACVCLHPGAERPECKYMTDSARIEKESQRNAFSFGWRDREGERLCETFFFWIHNVAASKLRIKFSFHLAGTNVRNVDPEMTATTKINIPYDGAGADMLTQHCSRRKSIQITETAIQAEKLWLNDRIEQLARVFMRFDAQEPGFITNYLIPAFTLALKVQPWDVPSKWDEADSISFVDVARWWMEDNTKRNLQRTEEYTKRFARWGTDGELNTEGLRRLCQDLGLDADRACFHLNLEDEVSFVSLQSFMTWAIAQETSRDFNFHAEDAEADFEDGSLLNSLHHTSTQLSTDIKAALQTLNSQLANVKHMVEEVQLTRRDPDIDADIQLNNLSISV